VWLNILSSRSWRGKINWERYYEIKKTYPLLRPKLHIPYEKKEWLSKKKNIHMHFTPTYSSWLNQIEIWFNILTKDVLKGGIWKSKEELVNQIMDYIKTYNMTRAKPFQWTYTGKALTIEYGNFKIITLDGLPGAYTLLISANMGCF
jgi:hypothetical protein